MNKKQMYEPPKADLFVFTRGLSMLESFSPISEGDDWVGGDLLDNELEEE